VRRIDSGPGPDRHPASVTWTDDRRPRARQLDGPAAAVAEGLRRRTAPPDLRSVAALWSRDRLEPSAPRRRPGRTRLLVDDGDRGEAADDGRPVSVGGDDVDGEGPSGGPYGRGPGRRVHTGTRVGLGGRPADEDLVAPDPDAGDPWAAVERPRRVAGIDAARRRAPRRRGVEGNARLTGSTAAVLFALLAVEGLTILSIRSLLSVHVFVGMLLIPPVLLKIGSTTWRFAKYYLGDPAYRRKGPPPPLLRLIGPVVVVLTLVVLGSGIALLLVPARLRTGMLLVHKASFVVWLLVMAIHVLSHLLDTARLAPRDWYRRTRRQVTGAGARQWALAGAVVLGLLAGALTLPAVTPWLLTGHG
jgi:hypothetical protein